MALDNVLGALLALVPDDAWVVVIGDNGTPRGALAPGMEISKVKGSVFEGGVRVPLYIKGPGVVPGSVFDTPVHAADLYPTFMHLAGQPMPGRALIDGRVIGTRTWLYTAGVQHSDQMHLTQVFEIKEPDRKINYQS